VTCKICKKRIKGASKNNKKIFLYFSPAGPVYVCGKQCYRAWEEG
jgi:hypothetical protein